MRAHSRSCDFQTPVNHRGQAGQTEGLWAALVEHTVAWDCVRLQQMKMKWSVFDRAALVYVSIADKPSVTNDGACP